MRWMSAYSFWSCSYTCCARWAINTVCTRFAGSTTTSCADAETAMRAITTRTNVTRRSMVASVSRPCRHGVRGQLEIAGQIDLDAMAFANRDRRRTIQETVHHLQRGLACAVRGTASDDHRPVALARTEAGGTERLRQPSDQTDGGRGPERGPVVLIYLIAESRIANLVQARQSIQRERAAVWHHEAMEGDGEPGLAERLYSFRVAEHARARRDHDVSPAVREHRVRHQTIDRRRAPAVEPVRQDRVDDRAFDDAVKRTRGTDRAGMEPRGRLVDRWF